MSEWRFAISNTARRYLKRLPKQEQARIVRELRALVLNPQDSDFKRLKGRSEWRLRVGSYRVLIEVNRDISLFFVTRIGPRGDVYKG